jgi:DNA-directed RNA polymerase subunit beta'
LIENELEILKKSIEFSDTENENFKKKRRIFKNRLKLINFFIQTKISPSWMTLIYLPVLPPNLRPIVKLQDKTIITTDLNYLYGKIIESNNKIKKLRKMSVPETFLTNEKNILQIKVDNLINNQKKVTNSKITTNL